MLSLSLQSLKPLASPFSDLTHNAFNCDFTFTPTHSGIFPPNAAWKQERSRLSGIKTQVPTLPTPGIPYPSNGAPATPHGEASTPLEGVCLSIHGRCHLRASDNSLALVTSITYVPATESREVAWCQWVHVSLSGLLQQITTLWMTKKKMTEMYSFSFGGWKSKIKVLAESVLAESPTPQTRSPGRTQPGETSQRAAYSGMPLPPCGPETPLHHLRHWNGRGSVTGVVSAHAPHLERHSGALPGEKPFTPSGSTSRLIVELNRRVKIRKF